MSRHGAWVLFRCRVAPGAFSGERLIAFELEGTEVEFVAPIDYVLDENKRPLRYGDERTHEGWVKGKLITQERDTYLTLMPVDHTFSLPKNRAELVTSGTA